MKKITSNEFLQAFKKSYSEVLCTRKFEYCNPWYDGLRSWTDFMLDHEGVLSNMVNKLLIGDERLKYVREWYTLDGLFIGGNDLFRKELHYPSSLYVLVEHELGNNLEEEMWKLIHWRAPLKVIIMYDFANSEIVRRNRKGNGNWLNDKINDLYKMLNSVNAFYAENTDTEYLFIIGTRVNSDSEIFWKYRTIKETKLNDLASIDNMMVNIHKE